MPAPVIERRRVYLAGLAETLRRNGFELVAPRNTVTGETMAADIVVLDPDTVDGVVAAIRRAAGQVPATSHEAVPPETSAVLSTREQQVLRHIARGFTHGQTARRLGVSPHTVDTYVKRIRAKLELGNKADLTRAAVALLSDMDDAA